MIYLLRCSKCNKRIEVNCSYKDTKRKVCVCGGDLYVDISTATIGTRVKRPKKYYRNIGGKVESGK